jgi:hypothetical protein
MIAEVSGLADVILVTTTFIMTSLFTIKFLDATLAYRIGKVQLEKANNEQPINDPSNLQRDQLIARVLKELERRFRPRLNLW